MPRANPTNDQEDRTKPPLSVAVGIIAVLTFAVALVGGAVVVICYGIGAPLLRASRSIAVASHVTDNESDHEPTSETAMTILPFEPPDAAPTKTFPLPEEFAALLDPIDAASQVVQTEAPHESPAHDQLRRESEKDRAPVEAPLKEDPQPATVASETLQPAPLQVPAPAQVDEESVEEPESQEPTPVGPDYWVISPNARRPSAYVVQRNRGDQRRLGPASFAQLGLGTPPAPGFTTPPAPMFTTPPAPMFTTPPAPGFTAPPAPGFTTPPAPGFTTPPAPGFTTPPAPGFTTPPAPGFTAPPAPGFTTPPAPGFTAPPVPGLPTHAREPGRPFRSRR